MISGKSLHRGKTPRLLLALCAAMVLLAASISSGSPTTAFAATPVTVGGKAVVTNTDGDPISIRQGAGTEYARIATAYQGQSVSVLDGPRNDTKGTTWFKVQAPGGTGWMMAEFLEGTSAPPTTPKLTGTARVANTNGDPLRMRSAPSTDGRVLTLLNPGATVTIQDGPVTDNTGTTWYKISAKGLTGWTMAQYLAKAEAPASTEPEAKPQTAPKAEPAAEQRANPPSTKEQYRIWMEEARTMYPYKQ